MRVTKRGNPPTTYSKKSSNWEAVHVPSDLNIGNLEDFLTSLAEAFANSNK